MGLIPPKVPDPQPAHQHFTVTQAQPQSMKLQGQFPGQGKVLGTPSCHEAAQCLCKHQRELASFTSSGGLAQPLVPLCSYSTMSEASSTPRHIAYLAYLQVFSSIPTLPVKVLAPSVLVLPFPHLGFMAEIIRQNGAFFEVHYLYLKET